MRFRQNFFNALVLLLLAGALQSGNAPQVVAVREYIRYAVSTDFDISLVTDKVRGLGSYSSRLNWDEVKRVFTPEKIAAIVSPARR